MTSESSTACDGSSSSRRRASTSWAVGRVRVIMQVSMRALRPVRATFRALVTESIGSDRLRARRLPVPPGSSPMATPVPASAAPTVRTVPSPPRGQTRSTPSATACRVWPVPGSSTVVGSHSGVAQPWSRQTWVSDSRTSSTSSNFVGLTMTAARCWRGASPPKAERGARSRPVSAESGGEPRRLPTARTSVRVRAMTAPSRARVRARASPHSAQLGSVVMAARYCRDGVANATRHTVGP